MITSTRRIIIIMLVGVMAISANGAKKWRYSKLYEPTNPTDQFYTTLPGLDLLANDQFGPLKGKTVAVVTNHTGINKEGRHILDLLLEEEGITVKVAFGPEHGISGNASAGKKIDDVSFTPTGIKIYSLYGASFKPTPDQLAGVDVIIFDIQDIGARYYTFVSTLTLVMDAAARDGIPIWVLDRPSPVRGDFIGGPLLDRDYASFVGMHPVPIRHGMTMGELAIMINEKGWLSDRRHALLTVVPALNWNRYDWWEDTQLPWVPPSPNIPTTEIALAYLGTCLFEGTNVSEGRGTYTPFVLIGAPWIAGGALADQLNRRNLPGVTFHDTIFTPVSIAGMSDHPKFQDEACGGVWLEITDRSLFEPIHAAAVMIYTISESYPRRFEWRETHLDRLWGSDKFRKYIDHGRNIDAHPHTYNDGRDAFYASRKPFLIYAD